MVQAVALMCVFGLGMCFALLGSIGVKLMPRLNIDKGKFGSLISAFMFTCLIASLITGVVVDKIGYKPVAIFGFIATAACILILAKGKSYNTALVPCLLLGFGAMALNTAGNTLIPVVLYNGENPAAASNLGNVFFGVGLFITPLLVSYLFRKTTYEKAVSVLAIIILVPVVFAAIAKYPAGNAGFAIKDAFLLLTKPAVLISAITLFCYISLESSFCNWLAPYAKEIFTRDMSGMDEQTIDARSQQMLSAFAIAMMAGRLITSQISSITTYGGYYIAGAAIVAGIVIIGMIKCGGIWTSVLAACAGFAFAPCFPTIVGVTFAKFDPSIYGSIFGIIFGVGLLGGVMIPKAIGTLSKGSTIQKSLRLLIPACVVLAVLAIILGKI